MVGLVFHSHPASWTQRNKATMQNCLPSSEIGGKNIYICIYISIYGTQPPGMTFEQLLKDKQIKKGWCYIWRTSYIIKIWRPIRSGDKLIQLRCGLAGVGAVEKHFAFLAPWEAFAVDCLPFQGEEGSSLLLCLCVPPVATIQSTV